MKGNDVLSNYTSGQLLVFLAVIIGVLFVVYFMLTTLIIFIRKWYINTLINKNMYNWFMFTNFGKAGVLLNSISKEQDIKSFKDDGSWTNFKKINNIFCEYDNKELQLMNDYLEKTTRKFGFFEDKIVNMLLVATSSLSIIISFISYLINSNATLLIFTSFIILCLFMRLKIYEDERNVREILLILIKRGFDDNNKINIEKENFEEDMKEQKNEVGAIQKSDNFWKEYFKSLCTSVKKIPKNIRSWMIRKPLHTIIIAIIVLVMVFILLFSIEIYSVIFNQVKSNLLNKNGIFYDREGNFAWVGITAIIAIITLFVNSLYNKRKFKADLVSKSRIEWIQEARKITVDLIQYTQQCMASANMIVILKEQIERYEKDVKKYKEKKMEIISTHDEEYKKLEKNHDLEEINTFINEINKNLIDIKKEITLNTIKLNSNRKNSLKEYILFTLYFGGNIENNEIVKIAEELYDFNEKVIDSFEDFREGGIDLKGLSVTLNNITSNCSEHILSFSSACRAYYKKEWDKAKLGK